MSIRPCSTTYQQPISQQRSSLAFGVLLSAFFLLSGCGSNDQEESERLLQVVEQQQQEIDKRQNAAEICEELFEAEQQRYLRLERWTRMEFVDPLDDTVITEEILRDISKEARNRLQDQVNLYQLKVSRRFDELIAMNKELKKEISRVGRSVNSEAESIRQAGQTQTHELRSQMVENSDRLDRYLSNTQEVSNRIEDLIATIQSFDRKEINCTTCFGKELKKKEERHAKKESFQQFAGTLIEDLVKLQSMASTAESP